jgi:histidyl-tRNA synthetase
LKGQLRQANSLGIKYTIIIGEKELENKAAVLRDMASGEQRTVPQSELIATLQQRLKVS